MLIFPRFGHGSGFLAAGCGAIVMLLAGQARASDPFALYAVPTAVDLLPSEATANQVVIHGAFLFLTVTQKTGTREVYGDPKCGRMYFQCPAGQEDLCRMQWSDLRHAGKASYCGGFGTLNMLSGATLRNEDAPLGSPDKWEMGMGVAMASYLGGQCPAAQGLNCQAPSANGGASGGGGGGAGGASSIGGRGGAGGVAGAAGSGVAGGPVGSGAAGGTGAGGGGGGGGVVATGGGPMASGGVSGGGMAGAIGSGGRTNGTVDAAVGGGGAKPGGGCAVGGSSPRRGSLAAGVAIIAAVVLARRRSRRP